MTVQNSPVWFITGCSTGFGRELAKAVLARGWHVAVSARDPFKTADIVSAHSARALNVKLDVTDEGEIGRAVEQVKRHFGRIDVLVNNAGSGYATSVEEGEPSAVRALFETNVFGLAEVTRQVLPIMRAQRSGWIVNLSSMAGIAGNPGTGYYAATKFAVEGLSDALAKEVEPLGIRVLLVEPGPHRTEFRRSTKRIAAHVRDYDATAGARLRAISDPSAAPGNPQRAAEAIIQAVTAEKPPMRLLLGRTALRNAREKLAAMQADFDAWEEVTLGVDDA